MLSQRGPEGHGKSKGPGALALVSFEPRPRERVFESRELEDARRSLINLIGRLAKVLPTEPDPEAVTTEAGLSLQRTRREDRFDAGGIRRDGPPRGSADCRADLSQVSCEPGDRGEDRCDPEPGE